jgi:hypothetical protein
MCVGAVPETIGKGKHKKSTIDSEVSRKHWVCISGGILNEG